MKRKYKIISNIRIAVIGFLLVLIPCIILSFLNFQSIGKRTSSIRSNYKFKAELIRDKIEHEIINKEEKLSYVLSDFPVKGESIDNLKLLLSGTRKHNPIIINPFILKKNGGVITTILASGWKKDKINLPQIHEYILTGYRKALNAEFVKRNYKVAAKLYIEELKNAASEDSVILISNAARCYFKAQDYLHSMKMYKRLLMFKNDKLNIGLVPVVIVSLTQIADIYNRVQEYNKQFYSLLKMYKNLLINPWNINEDGYNFYLKSTTNGIKKFCKNHSVNDSLKQIVNNLKKQEQKIHDNLSYANFLRSHILPKIDLPGRNQKDKTTELHHLFYQGKDFISQFGYFNLTGPFENKGIQIFGYQINKNYILKSLLPEILDGKDLRNNTFVGIINQKDSVLYGSQKLSKLKYLIAENFSGIFPKWKVALFDGEGKTIDQIILKEKQQSFLLFGLTIFVLIIGIVVIIIAIKHEYQVSKLKSEFVSNVSHELKTPLSIVRMYSETLESGIVTDKNKRQEFYGIMKRESERLSGLINNILDFSKIEKRKEEFNFIECDMVEAVKNIIDTYRPQIIAQGFQSDVNLPEEKIILRIDKDAISQAIINLLNNAVKYSDESKYISVELKETGNNIVISIADHGIGIHKKELKNIFENFYRITNSKTSVVKGTGLGLTIAKFIVESHNGTLTVESEVGIGSRFIINIPK